VAERDQIDDLIDRLMALPSVRDVDAQVEGIVDRIDSIGRRLALRSKETLGKHGLTWREWHVIVHLHVMGECSPKQLAERLVIGTGATTNLLDKLESAGLVQRRRNPEDARSVIIVPTRAGSAVWGKALNELGANERDAVAGALTDAEQKQLNRLLRKLVLALHKPDPAPADSR
jgi:DNA-binding MarR family transcriptional regulator